MDEDDRSSADEPRPRVLVVEDDLDVRLLVHSALGDTCWVLESRTVEEGLRLVRRECPDLIIFDRALEAFVESDVLALLASDPSTASVPVIVLVDKDERVHDSVEGLVKPVDPVELAERVAKVLGRRSEDITGSSSGEVISRLETRPAYSVSCDTDASTLATSTGLPGRKAPSRAAPPSLNLGDEIAGRYLVRELLGRGGMGEVYRVFDRQEHCDRAMKLMRVERSREIDRRRFLEEARIASVLEHEHVVKIHDFGETGDGRLFFVMDHCPGGTLSALLKREKTLKPQRAIEIARQLLSALELAHHQGILHRDIKPGNIVIGDDDRIQVLDFGLAKDVLHAGVDLARSKGRSLGTPLYMSPEHVRGEPSDPRTDLYAVGVVLYEMVCGRPPHYGGTAQAVMHGHLRIIPKPPSTHAYVSEAFDRVVLKALSKERRDRWQTAAEFAHALERLVQ